MNHSSVDLKFLFTQTKFLFSKYFYDFCYLRENEKSQLPRYCLFLQSTQLLSIFECAVGNRIWGPSRSRLCFRLSFLETELNNMKKKKIFPPHVINYFVVIREIKTELCIQMSFSESETNRFILHELGIFSRTKRDRN